jgi:hypothetical protein
MRGWRWADQPARSKTRSTERHAGATLRGASVTRHLVCPLFVLAVLSLQCSGARYSAEQGAPSLVLPARFAEGEGEPGKANAAPPSSAAAPAPSASAAAPPALKPSTAPDPTALRMSEQVEYDLELAEGKIRVVSVKPVKLASPIVTPRRLGRYAIELSIGQELIERLRFDFPATAADEPVVPGAKKPLSAPLTLAERAIARVKLLVPHSARVRRALLVDRGLDTATELDWPLPEVTRAAPAPSTSAVAVPPTPPPQP